MTYFIYHRRAYKIRPASTAHFFLSLLVTAVGYKYSTALQKVKNLGVRGSGSQNSIFLYYCCKNEQRQHKLTTQTYNSLSFNIAACFSQSLAKSCTTVSQLIICLFVVFGWLLNLLIDRSHCVKVNYPVLSVSTTIQFL